MASYRSLLLTIVTPLHRYIVQRDQMIELRIVTSETDLERPDEHGNPIVGCELAPLLDPRDTPSSSRRHAIVVPTSRHSVALLVDRIEDLHVVNEKTIQPMSPLFTWQLERPWFLGVTIYHETPLLVLDLQQIAHDVICMKDGEKNGTGYDQTADQPIHGNAGPQQTDH